jgi:hypothetical protein
VAQKHVNDTGIIASRAIQWRDNIEDKILNIIEYLCGTGLKLSVYTPLTTLSDPKACITDTVFEHLINEHESYSNWRSDMNDPLANLGMEAILRSLLSSPNICSNESLIRKVFLFTETYDALRFKKTRSLLSNLSN